MRTIVILGITSLLTDVSSEMVYPLLPLFLASLGGGPALLGLIEGISESTASLLKVFSGYWSDRLGRRRPLAIAGYAGSPLGKGLLAIAGTWGMVLLGRAVDRFGKGIRTAPRDALIVESVSPDARGTAFGLHRAMDTAGAAIGVALALLLVSFGTGNIRTIILLSILPALLGVALLFTVREPVRDSVRDPVREPLRFRWSFLPPELKRFLAITAFFTLGNSSNTFLLLRAGETSGTQGVLLLYLVYTLVYAISSYPAGRLSDRIGRRGVLIAGYIAYGIVYAGFAVAPAEAEAWFFLPLFSLYGIYSGMTEGAEKALVADLADPSLRATAIGLHATIEGTGLLPASLIAGGLWSLYGPEVSFALGGCSALAAALLLWTWMGKRGPGWASVSTTR